MPSQIEIDAADRGFKAMAQVELGTYTPVSGPALNDITFLVRRNVERLGAQTGLPEQQDEITFLKTEIAAAKRGDVATVDGDTITYIAKVLDDGFLETWSVFIS